VVATPPFSFGRNSMVVSIRSTLSIAGPSEDDVDAPHACMVTESTSYGSPFTWMTMSVIRSAESCSTITHNVSIVGIMIRDGNCKGKYAPSFTAVTLTLENVTVASFAASRRIASRLRMPSLRRRLGGAAALAGGCSLIALTS